MTKSWMQKKPFMPREARIRTDTPPAVTRLCFNENQFGCSPKATEAMNKAVAGIHIYPDFSTQFLKEKIGEKHGLSPYHVITGNGSSEIINQIGTLFAEPGSEIVFCEPTFGAYRDMADFNGAVCRTFPLDSKLRFDLDAMEEAISSDTKIVIVCNPNNPTGTFVDADHLEAFIRRIPKDILVVIDEAYIEYADHPACRSMLPLVREGLENLLILRTFSKIYGLAGARVGYGLGYPALIYELMRSFFPFNVGSVGVAGALAALDDDSHRDYVYRGNAEGRRYLTENLRALGCDVWDSQTSFVYFDAHMEPKKLQEAVQKQDIMIASYQHSRVSVGTMEQNQRFIAVMKSILSGR